MDNLKHNNMKNLKTIKEFYKSKEWTCYCSMDKVVYEYRISEGINYSPQLHVELKEELKPYFVELERPKTGNNKTDYLVSFINKLGSHNA